MIVYILFILLGMFLLVIGADALIRGGESIAKRFNVPDIVIGFTIIAFGTSAPELMVGIFAALKGVGDITIGNIIGSNIFNIMLVLGISSIIIPIKADIKSVKKYIPFSIIILLLLMFLGNDIIIFSSIKNTISRMDGFIFILFFIIYLYMNYKVWKSSDILEVEIKLYKIPLAIFMFLAGVFLLSYGGDITTKNAILLAKSMNISEKVIALTIIAIGTSLPELLTSLIATFKRKPDIAIGNIIGSNIFNVLLVLGMSSIVKPFVFNPILNIDIIILISFSIVLVCIIFINKNRYINRWGGGILIFFFTLYYIFILYRK